MRSVAKKTTQFPWQTGGIIANVDSPTLDTRGTLKIHSYQLVQRQGDYRLKSQLVDREWCGTTRKWLGDKF